MHVSFIYIFKNEKEDSFMLQRKQFKWLFVKCIALVLNRSANIQVEFLIEQIEHKVILEEQYVEQIELW